MSVADFIINDVKPALSHGFEGRPIRQFEDFLPWSYVTRLRVGMSLLVVELCERLAFFEVVCNLLPFCMVKLGYCNHQAAALNLCFVGTSILTPVLVGWLADVYLGRNRLVYMCLFLHFLGTVLLSVIAFPLEDFHIGAHHVANSIPREERGKLFHTALLAISLGTGGVRALICPPSAYMALLGRVMIFLAVVFLTISYIQHSAAWALVILMPFMSTLMVLVTLHMMSYNLLDQPETNLSLLTVLGVLANALETRCRWRDVLGSHRPRWIDQAKKKHGGCYSGPHVEDTKFVLFSLLPLFVSQLLYRVCVMQIPSGYYLQTMNSNLNLGGFLLPVSLMNAVSILPLLILTPFMDYLSTCLIPSKRDGPFLSACIMAGHVCAALSVMVAGFLEVHRKHYPSVEQPLSGTSHLVSSMTCFHLIPAYILLGVAETLVNPAFSVLAHRVSMSLSALFHGLAAFTGALLVEVAYLVSEGNWFPNTLNEGNLETFFFLLASLTLLNALGFWRVSQRYCNLNHFNAQNISGSNLEETYLLHEKSLKFYDSIQEISSSIDLWETAL
uniref:Solute carrier family 15, member 5 n=1 Tax=Jaculus jaculus TaxID=51337 RepID=A0A8C5P2I7_JACJA